jgi:lysozyme family protein
MDSKCIVKAFVVMVVHIQIEEKKSNFSEHLHNNDDLIPRQIITELSIVGDPAGPVIQETSREEFIASL